MTINSNSVMQKKHGSASPSKNGLLLAALFAGLMTVALLALLVVDLPDTVNWVTMALVGVNIVIWGLPVLRLLKSDGDLFHPLVLAALFFALPMIIVKGVFLAFGGYSYWLTWITNAPYYVNLALIYTAVGWLAVLVGFHLPLSGRMSRRLPLPGLIADEHRMALMPVLVAFGIGVGFNLILLREGAFGAALSVFSGNLAVVSLLRPLSNWMSMAFFLLVFGVTRYRGQKRWLVAALGAGAIVLGFTIIAGSRAALLSVLISIAAAMHYARYPRVAWRKLVPLLVLAALALVVGVLIITQYRHSRAVLYGAESISVEATLGLMATTLQGSADLSLQQQLSFVGDSLIERFMALDSFSVTLARTDTLRSAEQAAGIDNNIIKELILGFIPRALWPNKPLVGEFGLWFTRIYFDLPDSISSSGPTIFGDLYRNFRFLGVVFGMFLVGMYLRILYGSLILRGIKSPLAPLLYVFLYGAINWEATFTPFVTNGIRIVFAVATMTLLIQMLGGWRGVDKQRIRQQKLNPVIDDR